MQVWMGLAIILPIFEGTSGTKPTMKNGGKEVQRGSKNYFFFVAK